MTTTVAELTDTDRRVLGLAAHEAAHAVVGTIHGAAIERAVLAEDGSTGRCRFSGGSTFGAAPTVHRAEIAAAGAVAAAIVHHGRQATSHQVEALLGPGDREELRLAVMSSREPFTAPIMAVKPLIFRCWDAISTLAGRLATGGEIRQRDVRAALGLSNDPETAAFQLSLIRSGSAPGSFAVTG